MASRAERLDISVLLPRSIEFRARFEAMQRELNPSLFGWYPYDTFANFHHFERLLSGDRRRLLALAGGLPVIDIGCADGALAFFLESLGLRVHALDHPSSNYNRMQGVAALKEALGSRVEILAADLERELFLPEPLYGLAFLLGTLYHLKNPFHVLESLATRARYLLLSTRVARYTPGRRTDLAEEPVAYLLAAGEAASDWTNFWIFSEAGLGRLLDRSGWRVADYLVVGPGESAEPAACGADARAFCLAESRLAALENNLRLLEGWHELEYVTWRWTTKRFSVAADAPAGAGSIEFRFSIPDVIYERLGALTLGARINGVALAPQTFAAAGFHRYAAALPAGVSGELRIDFELDKALCDPAVEARELGLQVCFAKGEVDDGRLSDSPLALY
jgi:hypothetical protein